MDLSPAWSGDTVNVRGVARGLCALGPALAGGLCGHRLLV